MRIAICPGSFDPVTKGHVDIIKRAAGLFDKVIVLVLTNYNKHHTFSLEERKELIEKATCDIENVTVDIYDGLLANYALNVGAKSIVKGLRAVSDFEYEFQMALTNKKLNPELETVFLTATSEYMYLSSSLVKQVAEFGGDISEFLPPQIACDVMKKLCNKKIGG